jgi:hypothetical protein
MKLLNNSYRKLGFYLLALSLPITILTVVLLKNTISNFETFWDSWGLSVIYYPISIGLILISFSETKEEDSKIKELRLQSFFWGAMMLTGMCVAAPLIIFMVEKLIGSDLKILFPKSILSFLNLFLLFVNVYFYLNLKSANKRYFTF